MDISIFAVCRLYVERLSAKLCLKDLKSTAFSESLPIMIPPRYNTIIFQPSVSQQVYRLQIQCRILKKKTLFKNQD
tara:strand:+ start:122185 stop:122412 length:228 start_codon:yes stop_codon:yes gene_type:complete